MFCAVVVRLLGHKWQMMVERVRRREMLLQRSAASHSLGVSQKASVQFGMTRLGFDALVGRIHDDTKVFLLAAAVASFAPEEIAVYGLVIK